jgi:hypothetical protein
VTHPGYPTADDDAPAAASAEPLAAPPAEPQAEVPATFEAVPSTYEAAPPAPVSAGPAPAGAAPTVAVMPVPAPPTYDPNLLAPYSAPPVSGAYGYLAPISAFPAMAPPPRPKRTAVIVLAVLATLLLAASAALGVFTFQGRAEAERLSGELRDLRATHAEQTDTLKSTERQLASTKSDLGDSEDEVESLTGDNETLAACVKAVWALEDSIAAARGRSTTDVQQKAVDMASKCLAAETVANDQ